MLADLVGGGDNKSEENFRFELFEGDAVDSSGGAISEDGYVTQIISLDGTAQRKTPRELMDELDLEDADAKCDSKDDDDLLALMDSAK